MPSCSDQAQLLIREMIEDSPSTVAHSVHKRILHKVCESQCIAAYAGVFACVVGNEGCDMWFGL